MINSKNMKLLAFACAAICISCDCAHGVQRPTLAECVRIAAEKRVREQKIKIEAQKTTAERDSIIRHYNISDVTYNGLTALYGDIVRQSRILDDAKNLEKVIVRATPNLPGMDTGLSMERMAYLYNNLHNIRNGAELVMALNAFKEFVQSTKSYDMIDAMLKKLPNGHALGGNWLH